ncbi:sigma-70 family RNA polymerase sigma factor [Stenotrophomonas sp. CPCC 101365]|uniref:Sigma-70 family RNA polymerase sigma factor n=1 Tax=Stenotrophomonas mori TaxID=2871096 RepID=A0ABT0SGX6_9GAMM|nr:sigma-70 family RNA polymerase sigma factor [Stenotrophomonas mori]
MAPFSCDIRRRPANHPASSLLRASTALPPSPSEPPARFTELLQRHRGILLKVAGSYARQREDREDLAQEIAAQLWRAWPGYDPARPFSTWMYRIALNVAISQLRGRAWTPTLQAAPGDPLDTLPGAGGRAPAGPPAPVPGAQRHARRLAVVGDVGGAGGRAGRHRRRARFAGHGALVRGQPGNRAARLAGYRGAVSPGADLATAGAGAACRGSGRRLQPAPGPEDDRGAAPVRAGLAATSDNRPLSLPAPPCRPSISNWTASTSN